MLYLFRSDGENNPEQEGSVTSTCHAFRAKGTQCDSPGQHPGKCETKVQSPNGAKGSPLLITPFQGSAARSNGFLGRCPRLSHCAALRHNPSGTLSVMPEHKPDKSIPSTTPTFTQPSPTLRCLIPTSRFRILHCVPAAGERPPSRSVGVKVDAGPNWHAWRCGCGATCPRATTRGADETECHGHGLRPAGFRHRIAVSRGPPS